MQTRPYKSAISDYRDLDVWNEAMNLAVDIYAVTKDFPQEEMYGMTSQLRRSAASVPANIAEGFGRDQTGGFVQFLRVAQGSLKELETHIMLARRVDMLTDRVSVPLMQQCDRVGRMLRSLIRTLQAKTDRR